MLDDCGCLDYFSIENIIQIILPSNWDASITEDSLFVTLSKEENEKTYRIPLIIQPTEFVVIEQGLFEGEQTTIELIDSYVWSDKPEFREEKAEIVLSDTIMDTIDNNLCLPMFARTNAVGEIQMVFNHPIAFKYEDAELVSAIIQSGTMQVQLVSAMELSSAELAKFDWEVYLADEYTLIIQIVFKEPEQISSHGVDRDQFRIYFVQTAQFLQCEKAAFQESTTGERML